MYKSDKKKILFQHKLCNSMSITQLLERPFFSPVLQLEGLSPLSSPHSNRTKLLQKKKVGSDIQ